MISFVIPAYNEEASLPVTLDTLFEAANGLREPFEVIVVNDASTDRTAEIAKAKGARVVDLAACKIAAARNAGARAARGTILIFVDADTLVGAETLRAVRKSLNEGVAGGGARVRMDCTSWRLQVMFRTFIAIYHGLGLAAGCFLFARKDAFEAAGGFDERYFISEEVHLSRALRAQGRFLIVRSTVLTSCRKVRLYSMGALLRQTAYVLLHGSRGMQQRDGLDVWYDGRREPPSDS